MFTTTKFRHLVWGALVLGASHAQGQATVLGNAGAATNFLGWDNIGIGTNNFPLQVRHDRNQPIQWYTDALRRMLLHPTLMNQTVNGYTTVDLSGNLGVGLFNATTGSGPITRPLTLLHLDNGGTEAAGFRDWMRTGVTMTHLSDLIYVGLKQDTAEINTAAIVWSDNNQGGTIGPDRLRFIFTRAPGAGTVATSDEGLEIARMIPAANGNEGFVGIGDWQSVAWNANPVERLDVLDGRVRIRELPNDPTMDTETRYVVSDATGVLGWRNIPDPGPGSADCDWTFAGGSGNLRTAVGTPSTGCPGDLSHVSIGTTAPSGKLTVVENGTTPGGEIALHVTLNGNEGNNTGMLMRVNDNLEGSATNNGFDVQVRNGSNIARGMLLRTHLDAGRTTTAEVFGTDMVTYMNGEADETLGMHSNVQIGATGRSRNAFGARGLVNNAAPSGGDSTNVQYMYGVYGKVDGVFESARYAMYGQASNQPRSWAGYFAGKVYAQNGYFTSDAQLKANIEELSDCSELIQQIQPRSYDFNVDAWPNMGLPEGMQTGLIAQELQEVLPHLVDLAHHPAQRDEEGNVISEGTDILAVNYIGLMPYLIGALQEQINAQAAERSIITALAAQVAEQDAAIDELRAQMADMQQALAACCTASGSDGEQRSGSIVPDAATAPTTDRLLRIDPNPFTDRTTIRYTLERGGRTMLLVNSSDGKQLQVLHEEVKQAGEYQQVWQTSHLAPGIYYVTLLLDGEPLVKRAVKVQ